MLISEKYRSHIYDFSIESCNLNIYSPYVVNFMKPLKFPAAFIARDFSSFGWSFNSQHLTLQRINTYVYCVFVTWKVLIFVYDMPTTVVKVTGDGITTFIPISEGVFVILSVIIEFLRFYSYGDSGLICSWVGHEGAVWHDEGCIVLI